MYDNIKKINLVDNAVIAITTKSGTGLASWRIRRNDDDMSVEIAYELQPMDVASLTKKTHDTDADNTRRRAYYLLDMGGIAPHLHRAVTCVQPTEYPTKFSKKVIAFAGDSNGVKVTKSCNGMTFLDFTSQEKGSEDEATIFAVDFRSLNPEFVQKVQLVTLR